MNIRAVSIVLIIVCVTACVWAQGSSAKGVLSPADLKPLVPQSFFFGGRVAPVQAGQEAGLRFADGKLALAALLDTSGYATALPQKLQGMLINETPLSIGGSELKPGAYGFAFQAGKFNVMDVGDNKVLSVAAQRDEKVRPAVPLKIVEEGGKYRLYSGKDFVTIGKTK